MTISIDEKLLWGVVHNAGRMRVGRTPRWAAVMEATACGSTTARGLCGRFGADPEEMVGAADDGPDFEELKAALLPFRMAQVDGRGVEIAMEKAMEADADLRALLRLMCPQVPAATNTAQSRVSWADWKRLAAAADAALGEF